MEMLSKVLFGNDSYESKKAYIDNMVVDELMEVTESIIKEIIINSQEQTFYINNKLRKGNDWNSLVENVYINDDKVYLSIYYQYDNTDSSYSESFSKFFRRGEYFKKINNTSIDYKEGNKADVMQSILLQWIYKAFSKEGLKEELIKVYTDYKIMNPILDYFYDKLGLKKSFGLSKYSNRREVVNEKGYHYAKAKIYEYIKENIFQLMEKENKELEDIYKQVFNEAFEEFDKAFDYNKWKRECMLWY